MTAPPSEKLEEEISDARESISKLREILKGEAQANELMRSVLRQQSDAVVEAHRVITIMREALLFAQPCVKPMCIQLVDTSIANALAEADKLLEGK